jgi:hypothetical protein
MDFRRPGEHPVEEHYHHEDGTDGVMPPVHAPVTAGKPKRNKGDIFGTVMLSILLIATTGYGVYAYMNDQSLQTQLRDAESKLTVAQNEATALKSQVAKSKDLPTDADMDMSDKAQQSRVSVAAANFYCSIKDFGCDKVTSVITKFQPTKITEGSTVGQDGFAIVTATPATNGTGAKLYLKSENGVAWVVIFDGQNAPSKEIADKFDIPTSFR